MAYQASTDGLLCAHQYEHIHGNRSVWASTDGLPCAHKYEHIHGNRNDWTNKHRYKPW